MDVDTIPSTEHGARTFVDSTPPAMRRERRGDMSHIPGWGADLDHKNRPGVPMERTPARLPGVHWQAPEQQAIKPGVEIFHSSERPGITPIFGSVQPPSGLSGRLRALGFRYSESDLRHWLLLLAADRVNMGEGIIDDLAHGHIPNLFSEMGLQAEWKHNRAGFIKKAVLVSTVVGGAVYLLRRRGR